MTANPPRLQAPSTRFNLITADPPWSYDDESKNRGGALRHYDTMSLEEIQQIDLSEVAADDCLLIMWVTMPLLQEGIDTMKAWGFTYKTVAFTWAKRNSGTFKRFAVFVRHKMMDAIKSKFTSRSQLTQIMDGQTLQDWLADDWFMGMGSFTRANAELAILGVRGKNAAKLVANKGVRQLIEAPVREHSRKPDEFFKRCNKLVGDVPKLELFSREARPGWEALGDQCAGSNYALNESFQVIRLDPALTSNVTPVTLISER